MMFCCWDVERCKVLGDGLTWPRFDLRTLVATIPCNCWRHVFLRTKLYHTLYPPSPVLWKIVCCICRGLGKKKCFQVRTRVVVWSPNEGSGVFEVFKLVVQLTTRSSRSIASGLILECCIGLDVWLVMAVVIVEGKVGEKMSSSLLPKFPR